MASSALPTSTPPSRGVRVIFWSLVYAGTVWLGHAAGIPRGAEVGVGCAYLAALGPSSLACVVLGSLLASMGRMHALDELLLSTFGLVFSVGLGGLAARLVQFIAAPRLMGMHRGLGLLTGSALGIAVFHAWESNVPLALSLGAARQPGHGLANELTAGLTLTVLMRQFLRRTAEDRPRLPPRRQYGRGELAMVLIGLGISMGLSVLRIQGGSELTCLAIAWFALRFGPLGGATALLATLVTSGLAGREVVAQPALVIWTLAGLLGSILAQEWKERAQGSAETSLTYEALIRAWPLAAAVMDRDGRILTWNPAAEALFGFRQEEVFGQPSPIIPAERGAEFQRLREMLEKSETPAPLDTWRQKRDGSLIPVRIRATAVRNPQGQMRGVLGVFEDLTDQRRSEAAREQLAGILRTTTDFVGMADTNCRLTYLNAAGRRLLGLSETFDLSETSLAELIPEPYIGPLFEQVFPAAERDGVWAGEMSLRHRDGHAIPVSQLVLAHRASDGKLQFYSMIARDLSERMEAEAALRNTEEQLRQAQKMDAVGRLAGGIAHDFNNLLTVMLGFSEFALTKLDHGHPAAHDMEEVRNAAERAASLTRKLLTFSRKDAGEPRVFDLHELLSNLDTMLRRVLGESVRVDHLHVDDAAYVRADPGQIEQVLLNLAVNARDAMPEGGSLSIETSLVELDEGTTVAFVGGAEVVPGAYVCLTVRDSGEGMNDEIKSRIFEPFFTTKEAGKGTGLGLATVYGIVKQSAGFIHVDSEERSGSSFQVYLPRVSPAGEKVVAHSHVQALRGGRETVLLVEDESGVRELSRRILGGRGYHVLVASNAETALGLSRRYEGQIELLLTDVVMPGQSGPVLAKQLLEERPQLRVLFMSGYAGDALTDIDKLDAKTALISKPFLPNVLVRRVREALDAPGLGDPQRRSV